MRNKIISAILQYLWATVAILLCIACNFILVITFLRTLNKYEHILQENQAIRAHVAILREEGILRSIVMEKLPNASPDTSAKIAFEIFDGCKRTGIPSWLILALIETESEWKPDVVSRAGAMGLMQLMPATGLAYARMFGLNISDLKQFRDPVLNIRICTQVLYDNYSVSVMSGQSPQGDFTRALWLYNGRGDVYARKVMSKAAPYQKQLGGNEAP